MRLAIQTLLLICLLTLTTLACAADPETLTGKVVRIIDGDTIVLDAQGTKYRVRLAGIDAPERNQPWGDTSTRELRRQVAGQQVVVEWNKRDRWKRLIGIVRLDGEDVNLHIVERGLAWHYKHYEAEQTPAAAADLQRRGKGCSGRKKRPMVRPRTCASVGLAETVTSPRKIEFGWRSTLLLEPAKPSKQNLQPMSAVTYCASE